MAYVKKRRVYKKRAVPRRYKSKTGVKKIVTSMIRKHDQLRVEKKRVNVPYANTDSTMGQIAGNGNAYFASEISPLIVSGTGVDQRIGSMISLCSGHMSLQMRQMSAATAPVKMVFYVIMARGYNDNLPGDVVTSLFNTNNYIGAGTQIYDTGSEMNIDQVANYRILRRFRVNLKADQFSGQQMPVQLNVGFKFKKPIKIRYQGNLSTVINSGRLFLLGFSNNGNASTTTASTLANVPVTAVNTGQFINYNIKWYYTDE